MHDLNVRDLEAAERPWLEQQLRRLWGSTLIVSRGRTHDAARLPALICLCAENPVGFATFAFEAGACELVTLDAFEPGRGIGSALLDAATARARRHGCRRLWLVTTNDNLPALRFYQRRGLRLAALHPNAVDEARAIKPGIPEVGKYGIPIRDELELELGLG